MTFGLEVGLAVNLRQVLADLVALQYKRTDINFIRGTFRLRGDTLELFPAHLEDRAWRISFFGDEIESIQEFDPLTGQKSSRPEERQGLRQLALRDAEADAAPGDQGHPRGAPAGGSTNSTRRAGCWRRSGWRSARSSTSR